MKVNKFLVHINDGIREEIISKIRELCPNEPWLVYGMEYVRSTPTVKAWCASKSETTLDKCKIDLTERLMYAVEVASVACMFPKVVGISGEKYIHIERMPKAMLTVLDQAAYLLGPSWNRARMLTTLQQWVGHLIFGQKMYRVSAGLAEALFYTEIRGLHHQDFKLPYDAFYINVPASELSSVGDENLRSTIGRVTDIMVSKTESQDYMLISMALGTDKIPLSVGLFSEFDKLDDNIESIVCTSSPDSFGPDKMKKVVRWVVNVVLYLTCGNLDMMEDHIAVNAVAKRLWKKILKTPEGSKRRRKLEEELNKQGGATPRAYTVLGPSITVDRSVARESAHQGGTGTKVAVRTLVSGHWRNQPCGPGRKQRNRIWISPYWKGDEGPISNPIRVVKASEV